MCKLNHVSSRDRQALRIVGAVVLTALVSAASLTASAQEASSDGWTSAESVRTRAEIHDELMEAIASGEMKRFAMGLPYEAGAPSLLPRAQVAAEAEAAAAIGLICFGEGPCREASNAELDRVRQAGQRALLPASVADADTNANVNAD